MSRLVNRSKPFTGWKKFLSFGPILLFLIYVIASQQGTGFSRETMFLSVFFGLVGLVITYFMLSGVYWKSFTHLHPAKGRVLCIMPVYNEESHLVHEAIKALLRQTILPDVIHVVDDGSNPPLEVFNDPTGLVHFHRIKNSGKRHAQGHILKMYAPGEFDFILTVDSDSVLDDDAHERMLESMSDDRVMASTGMIFTRNWNTNLVTRLTDINVTISCLLYRMARSWLGIVSPTSGALALYRSEIVYDNLEDYLTSGTAGDDRRLSFYALMKGHVVGVAEAVVSTQLPTTFTGAFWQRMRWSKSAWLGTPFVWTNMSWLVILNYTFPLTFALMFPVGIGVLTAITFRYDSPVLVYGAIFWVVCSITQTMIYCLYRPSMSTKDKWIQFALSPFYPLFGLFILRPAAYWALTQLKSTSWHTRLSEVPVSEKESELVLHSGSTEVSVDPDKWFWEERSSKRL